VVLSIQLIHESLCGSTVERERERESQNRPRKIFSYDLSANPRGRNNIFHVDAIVTFRLTDFDNARMCCLYREDFHSSAFPRNVDGKEKTRNIIETEHAFLE